MRTTKNTPLLEEIKIMLEAALFNLEEGNLLDVEKLLGDALGDTYEAIRQVQGAREDAARMQGRVTVDTELLDLLAPKEDCESPSLEDILEGHTPLREAYYRLRCLDLNGAEIEATEIQEAWRNGGYDAEYRAIAARIHANCDSMKEDNK